jgi:hypothetical protein
MNPTWVGVTIGREQLTSAAERTGFADATPVGGEGDILQPVSRTDKATKAIEARRSRLPSCTCGYTPMGCHTVFISMKAVIR